MDKLLITPRTKIFDLLEAYPKLEETLISLTPQFKKLKNPVLRKTIAKITNLSQAASIGGLNVEVLVNTLREEIGQTSLRSDSESSITYNSICPEWYSAEAVVNTINISDMLSEGEQPVHEVLSAIKQLKDSEILQVTAPFIPAPLIDKSISLNYKHWLDKKSDEEYLVYFIVK